MLRGNMDMGALDAVFETGPEPFGGVDMGIASHPLLRRMVDGVTLTRLMVRFNVGCRVEETLYMRKLDEDFFAD